MSSCCPICYRVAEKQTISSKTEKQLLNNEAMQQRFFQLFTRFLNAKNKEVERRKPCQPDPFFNLSHLTGIGMLSCEQCLKLMDQFCQLFHQLKTTELLMDWKVEQMKNVMKSAQRVTTRMKAFREFANKLEGTAERMKGNEVFESVIQSRKLLISKCSKKLEGSFPKLSVRPWQPPDKENSDIVDELDNLNDETGSNIGISASGNYKEEREGEEDSYQAETELAGVQMGTHFQKTPDPVICEDKNKSSTEHTRGENAKDSIKEEKTVSEYFYCSDFSDSDKDVFGEGCTSSASKLTMEMDSSNKLSPSQPQPTTSNPSPVGSQEERVVEPHGSVNPKTGRILCGIGSAEFRRKPHYIRHHQTALMGIRLNCDGCSKSFARKVDLDSHRKKKHSHQYQNNFEQQQPCSTEKSLASGPLRPHKISEDTQAQQGSEKVESGFPKSFIEPWQPPNKEESKSSTKAVVELEGSYGDHVKLNNVRKSANHRHEHDEHDGEAEAPKLTTVATAVVKRHDAISKPDCESDTYSQKKGTLEPTLAAEGLFEPMFASFEDIFSEDSENEGLSHSDLSDSDKGGNETKPYSGATFEIVTEGEEVLGNVVKDPMPAGPEEAAKTNAEYDAHTFSEEILDNSLSDASSSVRSEPVQKRKRFYSNAVKKLKCKVVGCPGPEVFLRKENLTFHQSFHGQFQCLFCDSSYDYAPDLSLHELEAHRNDTRTGNWVSKILPCPRPNCSYYTGKQKKFLRHHLREHLGLDPKGLEDSDNCKICGIFFTGNRIVRNLQTHFDDFHNLDKLKEGETSLKCDQEGCPVYFMQPTQLWAHKRDVHEIFMCFNCDAVFKNSPGLVKHRQKHHPECFIHPCTFEGCRQRFKSKKGLKAHIKIKHHNNIVKQVKCSECDKLFSNGHILNIHMKSHAPKIKRHICEQCGKSFRFSEHLKLHYLSHSGPSSWEFMCSVCSKKCKTKAKLMEHMRSHTKEKPFVCELCGNKYSQRGHLRDHVNNKHGDQIQDIPKKYDKTNLTSRKGC